MLRLLNADLLKRKQQKSGPSPAPCPAPNPASEATLLHDNRDALLPFHQPAFTLQAPARCYVDNISLLQLHKLGTWEVTLGHCARACVLGQLCPLIQEKSVTPADAGAAQGQTLSAYRVF